MLTYAANSNFAVNRTRLSVRNISKALSEAQLKSLFHDTVVQAASAADKQGRGSRRVAGDKQASRHADREEGDNLGAVKVVSANLVQDKTKIDAATGKPVTKVASCVSNLRPHTRLKLLVYAALSYEALRYAATGKPVAKVLGLLTSANVLAY
jgi:hypothetical protein